MKKIIVSLLLIIVFTSNAFAVVPVAIPAVYWVASAVIHVAGAAAGIYYTYRSGTPSTVKSNGDVSVPSRVQWVDLTLSPPSVVSKDINASLPLSEIKKLAASDKTKYPNINSALSDTPDVPPLTKDSSIGDLVSIGAKNPDGSYDALAIGSKTITPMDGMNECISYAPTPGWVTIRDGAGSCDSFFTGYCGSMGMPCVNGGTRYEFGLISTIVPAVPTTPNKVAQKLAGKPVLLSENIVTAYDSEIQKMLQDSNYVPVFTDSTTGLPYDPPPSTSVMSPEQLTAYNETGKVMSPAELSSYQTAGAAAGSASAATQAATTAASTAAAAAAANPTDSGLAYQAAQAAAYAAQVKALEDKLKAEQAASAAAKAQDDALVAPTLGPDNGYDTDITGLPEKKGIGDLLGTFVASSPLVSMVKSFTVTTSSASGVVPIGNVYGQDLSFDFTRWESTLRACGGVLIIIMHGFAVFVVIRGW